MSRKLCNPNIPAFEIIEIGPQKRGVLFKGVFSQGGYTEEWIQLIAVVDFGGRELVDEVLSLNTGFNNAGWCGPTKEPCYDYNSVIQFLPGQSHNFYDAQVTTSGSKLVEGALVNF